MFRFILTLFPLLALSACTKPIPQEQPSTYHQIQETTEATTESAVNIPGQ